MLFKYTYHDLLKDVLNYSEGNAFNYSCVSNSTQGSSVDNLIRNLTLEKFLLLFT